MLRIGGDLRSVFVRAEDLQRACGVLDARCAEWNRTAAIAWRAAPLGSGIGVIGIDADRARLLDESTGVGPGYAITGFEFLTAGVIEAVRSLSVELGADVAYCERSYGVTVTDCAAAWADGQIAWGPIGSVVAAGEMASAAADMLHHLGVAANHVSEVLTAWGEASFNSLG